MLLKCKALKAQQCMFLGTFLLGVVDPSSILQSQWWQPAKLAEALEKSLP